MGHGDFGANQPSTPTRRSSQGTEHWCGQNASLALSSVIGKDASRPLKVIPSPEIHPLGSSCWYCGKYHRGPRRSPDRLSSAPRRSASPSIRRPGTRSRELTKPSAKSSRTLRRTHQPDLLRRVHFRLVPRTQHPTRDDNRLLRRIREVILDAGWRDLVAASICSSDALRGRPAPLMIFLEMDRAGIQHQRQVVNVGDIPLDLQAGTNAVVLLSGRRSDRIPWRGEPET